MKIGFLAMSGVRAHDPALTKLGLTLPGFVERGRTIASLPSLGLLTLAGYCPPHWLPSYREVPDNDISHIEAIVLAKPDLVAISSLAARALDAYALADKLRAEGLPVVIGGLHATVMSGEALSHADAVVVGDGEPAWRRILEDAEPGIYAEFTGAACISLAVMILFQGSICWTSKDTTDSRCKPLVAARSIVTSAPRLGCSGRREESRWD